MNKLFWLLVVLGLGSHAFAQEREITETFVNADEPLFSGVDQAEVEQSQYDLSDDEIKRVQRLRVMDSSYGVTNLSALELLGKYAKTDSERTKYARKHVIAMADNVGRSQAWGMAVYQASQETNLVELITRNNPTITAGLDSLRMSYPSEDYSDLNKVPVVKMEPKRTLMVSLDCGEECDRAFMRSFVEINEQKLSALDVVFTDTTNEDAQAIMDWARDLEVPKEYLERKLVNLHVDDDEFREMRGHLERVPRLIIP